jgi:hypothetical protein
MSRVCRYEPVLTRAKEKAMGERGFAARFVENPSAWRRQRRRGCSFADWGMAPLETRTEAEEGSQYPAVYVRELGGWMPALPGLCAAAFGETADEARESALRTRWASEVGGWLAIFPAECVGIGPDGEDLVRPTGRAVLEHIG